MPDRTPPTSRRRWPSVLLGAGLPLLTSIVLTSAVSLHLGPQQEALAGQRLHAALTAPPGSPLPENVEVLLLNTQAAPAPALSDTPLTTARWHDGNWYISTARRHPEGWQVARQLLDSAYAPVKSLQWLFLLCTLPIAALGGWLGWRLGR